MYAIVKATIFALHGDACAVCAGDRACKVNGGVATDLHHELVSRGHIAQWPDWKKELIHDEHNCAPVCAQVNTGAVGYPKWHDKVRRQMMLVLGRKRVGYDVSDVEAIRDGKAQISEWVSGLGLKTRVNLRYDGDDELAGTGDAKVGSADGEVEGAG